MVHTKRAQIWARYAYTRTQKKRTKQFERRAHCRHRSRNRENTRERERPHLSDGADDDGCDQRHADVRGHARQLCRAWHAHGGDAHQAVRLLTHNMGNGDIVMAQVYEPDLSNHDLARHWAERPAAEVVCALDSLSRRRSPQVAAVRTFGDVLEAGGAPAANTAVATSNVEGSSIRVRGAGPTFNESEPWTVVLAGQEEEPSLSEAVASSYK